MQADLKLCKIYQARKSSLQCSLVGKLRNYDTSSKFPFLSYHLLSQFISISNKYLQKFAQANLCALIYSLYCPRLSYLAAAGQSDWGWACQCHKWCLPPAETPAWSWAQYCNQTGEHCYKQAVSSQLPVSWGFQWMMGYRPQAAVHRVSTGRMSCWGVWRQGGGSTAAEAEGEHTVTGKWAGMLGEAQLEYKLKRWGCRRGSLWLMSLIWGTVAQTWVFPVFLPVVGQDLLQEK